MRLSGEFKIIIGAALFALIPVCVVFGEDLSVHSLLFGRLLLGSVILFLISKNKKLFFSLGRRELLVLFGWSQLMLGAMIAYFFAINYSSISVSSALLGTQPIAIILLAALFFKERISWFNSMAAVTTIIGILCITGVSEIGNPQFLKGELLAILSSFLLACNFMVQKKYLSKYSGSELVVFSGVFQLPFLIPFLFMESGKLTVQSASAIVILAVACTVLAYTLIYNGIKEVAAQKIGVLQSIEYVLPVIIGVLFFKEEPTLSAWLGICLILASCVAVGLRKEPVGH
jgi:drug/metabolite transporter (DMT)-like permease